MSAVDPARIESLIGHCDRILDDLGRTVSSSVCEDTEQLERLHDFLAREVESLTGLVRETLETLQTLARPE